MELGEESEKEHEGIVKLIDKYKWQEVVLVGDNFKSTRHLYTHLDNSAIAKKWLKEQQLENAQLLIKGSRSMQMENVLE